MATGAGRITIKDVAADLGVAISTVSNAYNRPDQLSPELRTKVFATAEKLGYAGPHPAARGLRSRSTGQIAVLLGQPLSDAFADPVTAATLEGLTLALSGRGLVLDLVPYHPNGGLPAADGVIVLNPDREDAVLRQAVQGQRPVVLVDSPAVDDHPGIEFGDDTAARGVMGHAIGLGHTRIAIVVDQLRSRSRAGRVPIADQDRATRTRTAGRLRGFRLAALNADLPWAAIPVYAAGADTEVAGRAITELVLSDVPTPTVIFCTSDRLAAGLLLAAREAGLAVPGALSVVGFDDTPLSRSTTPPLTTVRLDHRAKGAAAGETLLSLLDGRSLPSLAPVPAQNRCSGVVEGATCIMTDLMAASVAGAIEAALLSEVEAGDFDLAVEGESIDLATDDWTLHLDGFPTASGWIAIDNEPEEASGYGEAIRGAFQSAEIAALRHANAGLGGLIADALRRSDDAISIWFADFLDAG